jgi:hypothetical protein
MCILFLPIPSPINAGVDLNMGIEYPAAGIKIRSPASVLLQDLEAAASLLFSVS